MSYSTFAARAAAVVLLGLVVDAFGCAGAGPPGARTQGEGVVVSSLPPELRDEYALFAQRCSKCHSLARALNNGDRDEKYWALYVTRMRRQPSSGIAPEDEPPILRFLNYRSAQLRLESAPSASPPRVEIAPPPRVETPPDAGVEAGQP